MASLHLKSRIGVGEHTNYTPQVGMYRDRPRPRLTETELLGLGTYLMGTGTIV